MPRESAIGHWALQVGIPSACELTPDEAAREGAGQGGGGLVGLKASVSPPGLQLEGCQSLGVSGDLRTATGPKDPTAAGRRLWNECYGGGVREVWSPGGLPCTSEVARGLTHQAWCW